MSSVSDLRVGDAERDAAAERLRESYAQGRLTMDEFNDRLSAALAATTQRELSQLTRDLPTNYDKVAAIQQYLRSPSFTYDLNGAPTDTAHRSCNSRTTAGVTIALRADFYGRCAAYPELSSLLAPNHVLVGPMRRDELRRAVECPAQRVGLRVEPELADALVADIEDEPGGLPLLSAALLELWQHRDGRRTGELASVRPSPFNRRCGWNDANQGFPKRGRHLYRHHQWHSDDHSEWLGSTELHRGADGGTRTIAAILPRSGWDLPATKRLNIRPLTS